MLKEQQANFRKIIDQRAFNKLLELEMLKDRKEVDHDDPDCRLIETKDLEFSPKIPEPVADYKYPSVPNFDVSLLGIPVSE